MADWNPLDWWTDGLEAALRIPQDVGALATNWLTGIGGQVASGIEGAMVAIIGDIWNVITGPLEIIVGAIIIIIVLGWAFKNQVIQLGGLAVRMAA